MPHILTPAETFSKAKCKPLLSRSKTHYRTNTTPKYLFWSSANECSRIKEVIKASVDWCKIPHFAYSLYEVIVATLLLYDSSCLLS